jgi:hypothetical protein
MIENIGVISALAGVLSGVVSWIATDFVARPVRRFFQMRGEIFQCMLYFDNVRAPVSERETTTADFTTDDAANLKEAQSALRRLDVQMQSFAATERLASMRVALKYDPMKAGRSLIGYSNRIGIYGSERAERRKDVLAALRIKEE